MSKRNRPLSGSGSDDWPGIQEEARRERAMAAEYDREHNAPDPDEGLQDARDDSDPGECDPDCERDWETDPPDEYHPITGDPPSWRDRYDTYDEFKGER